MTDDPRVVRRTIGGREYRFWICNRGQRLARNHGFEVGAEVGDPVEQILLGLWVAYLPFEDIPFEEFEMRFCMADYPALMEVTTEIAEKQLGPESKNLGAET